MADTNEKMVHLKNNVNNSPSWEALGSYYVPQNAIPFVEKVEPMGLKDGLFMVLFAVLTFLFIHFAFPAFNLAYSVWFYILFAVSTVYLNDKKEKASPFIYLCGGLSLVSAAANSIYENESLNMLNVIAASILFAIYLGGISRAFKHKEGSYKLLTETAFGVLFAPFKNLAKVFKAFKCSLKNRKSKVNLNILIGILLAIPFLAVIIPLLASEDVAFKGLVENTITGVIDSLGKYFAEFIFVLIFAPLFISYMYSLKAKLGKNETVSGKQKQKGGIAGSISVSFLSMISLTYIAYLFSQLAYFFSAFSGILPDGYEYSESVYARKGFYEIFIICIINISIIMAVTLLTKKDKGRASTLIKALECFICGISILFIITAMAKMVMNIQHFGLSVNRMLVSLLEIMMFVVIVFIIVHIFLPKVNYMQAIVIICAVLFIGFIYMDADAVVAKYNIEAYKKGNLSSLDVNYLGTLSDSATPYIAELAKDRNSAHQSVRNDAERVLKKRSRLKYDENNKVVNNRPFAFKQFCVMEKAADNAILDFYNSIDDADKDKFVNGSKVSYYS